jgi:hypothetical protein
MYPKTQLGWAGSNGLYPHHSSAMRTPAYRHLAIAAVIFICALFMGTSEVIRVLAAKQVAYQPAVAVTAITAVQPTPPTAVPVALTPPAAQPAVAPPAVDHSAQVQAVLNSWNASHASQKWSVVVQGIGTDQTKAALNPNNSYNTASVYKLFMMYPLFKSYSLDSLATASVNVEGRGSTSLKNCVELAIKNSDNPCGEAMGYKLGWGRATTLLKQLGMTGTNLNSSNLTTTAADANLYLQRLYAGQLMSPDEQQYLLGLMQQQKYRGGIPAGCSGCIVDDKTGDLGVVRHDVGIVQDADKVYSLSIMTNGASYAQIAQLTSQIQAAIKS